MIYVGITIHIKAKCNSKIYVTHTVEAVHSVYLGLRADEKKKKKKKDYTLKIQLTFKNHWSLYVLVETLSFASFSPITFWVKVAPTLYTDADRKEWVIKIDQDVAKLSSSATGWYW